MEVVGTSRFLAIKSTMLQRQTLILDMLIWLSYGNTSSTVFNPLLHGEMFESPVPFQHNQFIYIGDYGASTIATISFQIGLTV